MSGQPVLKGLPCLQAHRLSQLQERLPSEVVVGHDDPGRRMDDLGEVPEEGQHVDEVPDDVAHDDVVERARQRKLLDVAAHEPEVGVVLAGRSKGGEGDVDAHSPRWTKRREERAVATPEIQDTRARWHLTADEPVEVLVVGAVADPRAGPISLDPVEMHPYPPSGPVVQKAGRVGDSRRVVDRMMLHEPGILGPRMGASDVSERKRALITGITGQDGSYLAELLLSKG